LPLALLVRFVIHGWWSELTAAALYLVGYFIAWRVLGLDPSDRAVLDQLFERKKALGAEQKEVARKAQAPAITETH